MSEVGEGGSANISPEKKNRGKKERTITPLTDEEVQALLEKTTPQRPLFHIPPSTDDDPHFIHSGAGIRQGLAKVRTSHRGIGALVIPKFAFDPNGQSKYVDCQLQVSTVVDWINLTEPGNEDPDNQSQVPTRTLSPKLGKREIKVARKDIVEIKKWKDLYPEYDDPQSLGLLF